MKLTLADAERKHIPKILDVCGGNRTRAASMLDISVRCLRNKLREYRNAALHGLSRDDGQHFYGY